MAPPLPYSRAALAVLPFRLLCLLVGALWVGWASPAAAEPMKVDELPPELRVWVPWVLHGQGEKACPVLGESAVCVWPGTLELELDERGGRFRQRVVADREALVALPGSGERWPQEVQLGTKGAVVLEVEGRPVVRVGAGEHELKGRFFWPRLPERLAVPQQTALVELSIRGKRSATTHRGEDGSVWLAAADPARGQDPERLDLEVFRRLADGVPMRLQTKLALRVGGRSRELTLRGALPSGARPLAVTSELPVRLEPSGVLTVQLRPGQYTVEIDAVVPADTPELLAPVPEGSWPEQEVWVFAPDNRLRQLDVSGAPGVDPQRTNLPPEWKSLRAFLLEPGGKLQLSTLRRGEPEAPPNRLTLNRHLWLDLDGAGFTVRDLFSGTLQRDHRLALEVGQLGHAVAAGDDQLIVRTEAGHSAVELRTSQVDLRAEWRLEEASRTVPAVGWSADVEQLSAQLHLPPGWALLGATGVDVLSHSWIADWNLFDVFFVLVVALGVARLFGVGWGAVALAGLVLSRGEEDAPYFLWAALLLCAAVLLVVPAGKLRWLLRSAWWLTAVSLVVLYVGFAVGQAQAAFYPATVSDGTRSGGWLEANETFAVQEAAAPAAPPPLQSATESMPDTEGGGAARQDLKQDAASSGMVAQSQRYGLGEAKLRKKAAALRQDPTAVVQTGPGVPTWQWRTWELQWTGPVERAHEMRLWLISPWQNALLAVARIVLLGVLLWILLRRPPASDRPADSRPRLRWAFWGRKAAPAAAASVVLLTALPSRGEAPKKELLDELRERITAAPECGSECVSVSSLVVDVRERTLELTADVHVGSTAGYQLPGPVQNLTYSSITVDGKASHGLVRWHDGFLHLRLTPGRHEVVLTAPLPRDELVLSLGTPPKHVRVAASGWQVDGVQEDGRVDGSLAFTRVASAETGGEEAASPSSDLPPWFEVRRRIVLGVTWSIETTVQRVSPTGQPLVVRLPLLPQEQVTEAGLAVERGEVVLSFDRGAEQISFESSLGVQPALALVAAQGKPWSEQWTLECGVLWHCELDGIAPYEHEARPPDDASSGPRWLPSFRPWPGEKLTVSVQRPEASPGPSVTTDSARLVLEPGTRLTRAELLLRVRSSTGGVQLVELPSDARNFELTVNGTPQPLKREGSQVSVPLTPGVNQVRVVWQEPSGLVALWQAPVVKLAGGAVNAEVTVALPGDRWLLRTAARGSDWGPAVLFWPYLALVLAAGLLLARLPRSPLRSWEWMLLGLGLAVVPAPVAVIVASWFFLLAFRDRYLPTGPALYNLVQLSLLGWSVVFLGCLIGVVYNGLVVQPDMSVAGFGSSHQRLVWYTDRIASELPVPSVLSAPLWVWRLVMLGWALWLAFALLGWLRWGFGCFSAGGAFRPMRPQVAPPASGSTEPVSSEMAPSEPVSTEPLSTETASGEDQEPEAQVTDTTK
jgi:hypothetical protein